MDYDLTPYLEEDDYKLINDITIHLDEIMDELFFGKQLTFVEILKDIKHLEYVKVLYILLFQKNKNKLRSDAKLLSRDAGKEFIISWMTIMSAYFIPVMALPSIISFSKGMRYYTAYKVLSNEDVVDEYLSTFDNLLKRINNYNEVLISKYKNMLESNPNYSIIISLINGNNIKIDRQTEEEIINYLNLQLGCKCIGIEEAINKLENYIIDIQSKENKTLILEN